MNEMNDFGPLFLRSSYVAVATCMKWFFAADLSPMSGPAARLLLNASPYSPLRPAEISDNAIAPGCSTRGISAFRHVLEKFRAVSRIENEESCSS
jgi:hypothetical protein